MKERRIEAAAVEINRIGPVTVDAWAGDEVVVEVAHRGPARSGDTAAAETFYVRVNEPEQSVGVAETWSPDAARVRVTEHVKLAGAIQRTGEEPPVYEIARMMHLHPGKPLEGGGGDVVIVADAHDGWVGIEAREN